jgi:hypothetical protein
MTPFSLAGQNEKYLAFLDTVGGSAEHLQGADARLLRPLPGASKILTYRFISFEHSLHFNRLVTCREGL